MSMKHHPQPAVPGIRKAIFDVTPYVPGKFVEDVRDQFDLTEVVKIASNENPYGPYPKSLEMMAREVVNLNRYPDSNFTALRRAIGDVHDLSLDSIAISHGAEGMLQTIGKCFIQEGDEVLVPSATYALYAEISKTMGASVIDIPMSDFSVDLDAVAAGLSARTKLIWIANPNNPTGTVVDKRRFSKLCRNLPPATWVVLDEAYAEFAAQALLPCRVALIREGVNIISVRTFSKAYGLAGARLGYALAREEIVTIINTVSEPFNANRIALAGALAAMHEDGAIFRQTVSTIQNDREKTHRELLGLGLRVIPSQANFVMFETPFAADQVFNALLAKGIIVRPCSGFGYPRMLRVTIGTAREMEFFFSALKQVLNALREL